MKVKEKLLRRILDDYVMSGAEFAREMGVDASEVEKLLNGEKVGADTAKRFVAYLGPVEARRLTDLNASGNKRGDGDL